MLKIRRTMPFIMVFVVVIAITWIGLSLYNTNLKSQLISQAFKTLNEIKDQQKFNFKSELNAQINNLTTNSAVLAHMDHENEKDKSEIVSVLKEVAHKTKFECMIIANVKGDSINSNGDIVNISDTQMHQRAIIGETFVGEPVKSMISDKMIVPIATPITKDGKILGILMGGLGIEQLCELLLPTYHGEGYAFIVNGNGDIIANAENNLKVSESNNLLDSWFKNEAAFTKPQTVDTILADMQQGNSGNLNCIAQGQNCIVAYCPVEINDWYLFVAVPDNVIAQNSKSISNWAEALAATIIICFTILMIYIFIIQRRSAKKEEEHIFQLEKIAFVDEITGYRNYNKFKIDAQKILEKDDDLTHIIVKMDVENFKLINKIYGFELGNHILKVIAQTIDSLLVEGEIFARTSVDEFVMLHVFKGKQYQLDIKDSFISRFYENMGADFNYKVKFKIGQYIIDKDEAKTSDITEFFEMANFAHKKAKQSTTMDVIFYDESMSNQALHQKEIENMMEKSLIDNEFLVYLQPKYRLKDESIVGAEALVRWKKVDGTMVYPNDFIPVFEKNGFVTKLDMYMLSKVCAIIKSWISNGITPITVSVNFSRLHLSNIEFVDELCEIVDRYDVERKYIEIEITETVIFENLKAFEQVLHALHNAGFTLSMDDFGSGYSSLGLLKNLAVDVIKIDRSFFISQDNDHRTRTVVANVIRMADELSIHTVAEGVEDKVYIDLLCGLGCDMVQGYYYAKPMPENEFTQRLIENEKRHPNI